MSFDWNKYVVLADELRQPGGAAGVESRLRTSVSRAYYGLFHLTRTRLEKEGVRFEAKFDIHQQVVKSLRTSGDSNRKMLGVAMGRLRMCRNEADYDSDVLNIADLDSRALLLRTSISRWMKALGWVS